MAVRNPHILIYGCQKPTHTHLWVSETHTHPSMAVRNPDILIYGCQKPPHTHLWLSETPTHPYMAVRNPPHTHLWLSEPLTHPSMAVSKKKPIYGCVTNPYLRYITNILMSQLGQNVIYQNTTATILSTVSPSCQNPMYGQSDPYQNPLYGQSAPFQNSMYGQSDPCKIPLCMVSQSAVRTPCIWSVSLLSEFLYLVI